MPLWGADRAKPCRTDLCPHRGAEKDYICRKRNEICQD